VVSDRGSGLYTADGRARCVHPLTRPSLCARPRLREMLCDATMTAPGAVGTLWTTAFITPPCSAHRLPRRVGAPGSPFAAGPSFVHAQEAAIPSRWRPHLCGGPGPIGGRPSEARPQLVREYNLSHYPVGHGLPSRPPDRTLFTRVRGVGILRTSPIQSSRKFTSQHYA
jgi:hypothetical protein